MHRPIRTAFFFALSYCIIYAETYRARQVNLPTGPTGGTSRDDNVRVLRSLHGDSPGEDR